MRFRLGVTLTCAALLYSAPAAAEPVDMTQLVAVLDFELAKGVSKQIREPFTEGVIAAVLNQSGMRVIDAANRDKILEEQGFQCTGAVGECRVEIGQLLGAGRLVTGKIHRVDKSFVLGATLLDVGSGEVLSQAQHRCECDVTELLDVPPKLVSKLLKGAGLGGSPSSGLVGGGYPEEREETPAQTQSRKWAMTGLKQTELADFQGSGLSLPAWLDEQAEAGRSTRFTGQLISGGGVALMIAGVATLGAGGYFGCAGKSDEEPVFIQPPANRRDGLSPRERCFEDKQGVLIGGLVLGGLGAIATGFGGWLWYSGHTTVDRYERAGQKAARLGIAASPSGVSGLLSVAF